MTFAQRGNCLRTHFSEPISLVKRRMTVVSTKTAIICADMQRQCCPIQAVTHPVYYHWTPHSFSSSKLHIRVRAIRFGDSDRGTTGVPDVYTDWSTGVSASGGGRVQEFSPSLQLGCGTHPASYPWVRRAFRAETDCGMQLPPTFV